MNWKQIRFIESHNNRIFYQAKFERDFSLNRFETNNDIHILAMVSTYDRCIYDTLRISTPTFVHNSVHFSRLLVLHVRSFIRNVHQTSRQTATSYVYRTKSDAYTYLRYVR